MFANTLQVISNANPRDIEPPKWGSILEPALKQKEHGHLVSSYAVGEKFGVAPSANLVFVHAKNSDSMAFEKLVEAFALLADDAKTLYADIPPDEKHPGRAVVVLPFGLPANYADDTEIMTTMCKLTLELEKLKLCN